MRFIEILKNIWKIEDLRHRLIITASLVAVYRFGSFVVLPGIDPALLTVLQNNASSGLLGLLDMFSGGAFSNASIFALGIMPYISASIVMQLLGIAVPYFQKLQREGESGHTKMNQYTRYLTVAILVLQGPAYIYGALQGAIPGGFWDWVLPSTIILAAGSMFVLWLGERITDKGVGNGVSFIILIGIIARLPHALVAEVDRLLNAPGGLLVLLLEILFLMIVTAFAIMLVQCTRKVPVQYAKRIVGNKQYGGVRQYIPLKVNAANVMPIIFAVSLMMLPPFLGRILTLTGREFWVNLGEQLNIIFSPTSIWYLLIYFVLVFVFSYFSAIIFFNAEDISEELKKSGAFIPGIRPGGPTRKYLEYVVTRVTFAGAIFLASIAVLPTIAQMITGIQALAIGGTSLLIVVSVILEIVIDFRKSR